MDDLMKERILRRLETLPDDKAHQVLDYLEFLQSKYAGRSNQPSTFEKLADRVEDTMRAGRISVSAIKGTRDVLGAAGKVMQGLADAGKTVIDELQSPKPDATGEQSPPPPAAADDEPETKPPPAEGDSPRG